jgi:hypothetical protein
LTPLTLMNLVSAGSYVDMFAISWESNLEKSYVSGESDGVSAHEECTKRYIRVEGLLAPA